RFAQDDKFTGSGPAGRRRWRLTVAWNRSHAAPLYNAPMEVRRIRTDEGLVLREIRLRALAGAPDAFGTTLAEALADAEQDWHDRAARRATDQAGEAMFFAEEGGQVVGMAGGFLDPDPTGIVDLVAMWVDPPVRGRGAGRALIEAVADWARGRGATRLQLQVTDTNAPAIALYTKAGFTPAGNRQPLPSNPALTESTMSRSL
ncbi:MAG: GNAT family N-acetyltransferase, partial [Dehalococcoidia bacterium]